MIAQGLSTHETDQAGCPRALFHCGGLHDDFASATLHLKSGDSQSKPKSCKPPVCCHMAERELLEAERSRLLNAVSHLKRSNVEIVEAQATDADPLLQQALEENLSVIQKYECEIDRLEEEILAVGGHGSVPNGSAPMQH